MDRNQAIGLVLITVIMMLYFMYVGSQQQDIPPAQEVKTEAKKEAPKNTASNVSTPAEDSIRKQKLGTFGAVATGEAKEDVLENKDIKVTFNSRGGKIEQVWLKNYLTYDKKPLYLITKDNNQMDYIITVPNGVVNLNDLYFTPSKTDSSLVYRATLGTNQYVEQVYKLSKEGYLVDYKLNLIGLDNLVSNEPVRFNWKMELLNTERDVKQSREKTTVNYYTTEDEFDHLAPSDETQQEKLESPAKWVSMKAKFFCSSIITENTFSEAVVSSKVDLNDTTNVKHLETNLTIPIGDLKTGKGNFKYYFGPSQFAILNDVPAPSFHKNVDLGWPGISFINRFIVVPVFHFLETFISNYGIIIVILVILIKLILFPLSYKSYISMAKMKVLKPEIDEIKERVGDDMQKVQMETMELYRKVGINPLSGCIPVLLQMPILLAMFNFFPNSIELRQEAFLWAEDLSTFDAPIWLPFEIPFYGSHVSLFTLLMTLSTIAYTWYNNQVSTVTGPMKTVSYIMPVVFMFVLNSFPAGLSFYYFVSNIVSIGQQIIIRKFVDDNKIKATLEQNKKKIAANPNKKSRWMSRLEDAMKAKEEEMKKKKKK